MGVNQSPDLHRQESTCRRYCHPPGLWQFHLVSRVVAEQLITGKYHVTSMESSIHLCLHGFECNWIIGSYRNPGACHRCTHSHLSSQPTQILDPAHLSISSRGSTVAKKQISRSRTEVEEENKLRLEVGICWTTIPCVLPTGQDDSRGLP